MLDTTPPTIIIGTPGRIYDLVKLNYLKLDKLQYFILDECDKMLEQLGIHLIYLINIFFGLINNIMI